MTYTKALSFLIASLALTATAASHAANTDTPRPLTREEVRADLEAWQRSGLQEKVRGEGGTPFFHPDYQQRMAEYQKLRANPSQAPTPAPTR